MTVTKLVSELYRVKSLVEDSLKNYAKEKTDKNKIIFLMVEAQRVHEICHRICSDYTQPYINDEAERKVVSEVSKLKSIIKEQKSLIHKLSSQLGELD